MKRTWTDKQRKAFFAKLGKKLRVKLPATKAMYRSRVDIKHKVTKGKVKGKVVKPKYKHPRNAPRPKGWR